MTVALIRFILGFFFYLPFFLLEGHDTMKASIVLKGILHEKKAFPSYRNTWGNKYCDYDDYYDKKYINCFNYNYALCRFI